jgi:uncharacterized membrane protein YqjE
MYRNDLPRPSGEVDGAGTRTAFAPSSELTARIAQRLSGNIIAMLQIYAALAKEEAQRTARHMARAALFLALAAVLGVYVLSLALATGILALSTVVRPWLAAFIVLLITAATTAIFAVLGVRRLKPRSMLALLHEFEEDVQWLQREIIGRS